MGMYENQKYTKILWQHIIYIYIYIYIYYMFMNILKYKMICTNGR